MQNEKDKKSTTGYTGKDKGPQGVDKAPGEESSSSTDNTVYDSQKGKGKNYGDPSQKSDQPIDSL